MTMVVEVYKGFQLTVVEQPAGRFFVDITPIGGGGRTVATQAHGNASDALASARLIIDRGVLDGDRGVIDLG